MSYSMPTNIQAAPINLLSRVFPLGIDENVSCCLMSLSCFHVLPAGGMKPKAIVVVLENLHSEHVNRRDVQNAVQPQTGGERTFDATNVHDEVCGQV